MHPRLPVMYTVGHSTRSLAELVEVLEGAGVEEVVDVRSVPRSRRHPQFEAAALARSLPARGVAYTHEGALGGFRRPDRRSPNRGWEHVAFRAMPTTWQARSSSWRCSGCNTGRASGP